MTRNVKRAAAVAMLLLLAAHGSLWAQQAETASIGAALAVSSLTHNGAGVYTVVYRISLVNAGDVDLSEVQIEMDLATAFEDAGPFHIVSARSLEFTLDAEFDGEEQTSLLTGTDTLATGGTASIEIIVEVEASEESGPHDTSITVKGQPPSGDAVSDVSQFGADPDPDADGDPGNNSNPTPVVFVETPRVGAALRLHTQSENPDGSYDVAYDITVINYGDVTLSELSLSPGLRSALADRAEFQIVSIASETLEIRSDYDGREGTALLAEGNTLAVGEEASVGMVVRVSPLADLPRFEDRVLVSAMSPLGTAVADLSQRGSDPDPDEDGDPSNNSQISRAILALLSIGGQMNLTVSASETDGLSIDGMVLNVFASLQDYAVQVTADLPSTGLSALSIAASGPLGPIELSSALAFDATAVSFESWQAGAAFEFFGIDIVDVMTLSSPQTASLNQVTLSASSGDISFQGTIKHGICPLAFEAVNVCGSWDWSDCDVSMSACLLFTDEGFDSFTVSLSDYTIFEDFFGATGTLDVSIIYTPERKSLFPTLAVEADWLVCPEISLLGEVQLTSSAIGIDGFSVYGIAVEVPVGPVVFELKDSFDDAKNGAVTGKAEYFEVVGISGPIASCCGAPGSFSVQTFFERGPNPPSGGLFGIGLLTGSLQVQVFDGFGFAITAEYRPVSPTWSVVFESTVIW